MNRRKAFFCIQRMLDLAQQRSKFKGKAANFVRHVVVAGSRTTIRDHEVALDLRNEGFAVIFVGASCLDHLDDDGRSLQGTLETGSTPSTKPDVTLRASWAISSPVSTCS